MKCCERVVLDELNNQVSAHLDPLQFANRRGVGVEDAVLHMIHRVSPHGVCTLVPHILAKKLIDLKLNNSSVAGALDYLTSRPQYVRIERKVSSTIFTNTGAPHGTVPCPFLFSLFTSDIRASPESG